jgi:hypothetical protein
MVHRRIKGKSMARYSKLKSVDPFNKKKKGIQGSFILFPFLFSIIQLSKFLKRKRKEMISKETRKTIVCHTHLDVSYA